MSGYKPTIKDVLRNGKENNSVYKRALDHITMLEQRVYNLETKLTYAESRISYLKDKELE